MVVAAVLVVGADEVALAVVAVPEVAEVAAVLHLLAIEKQDLVVSQIVLICYRQSAEVGVEV